jgi:hypothetical protein
MVMASRKITADMSFVKVIEICPESIEIFRQYMRTLIRVVIFTEWTSMRF